MMRAYSKAGRLRRSTHGAVATGRVGGQLGATAVEYALGVALLCVASLGTMEILNDNASDDFNDRADRSGAPDLTSEAGDGGTTGGTTGGSDGSDGPIPTIDVVFAGFDKPTQSGKKNDPWWSAGISVLVDDTDGKPVGGVRVDGTWSYLDGSTPISVPVVCNQTQVQGNTASCKFQLSEIPPNVAEVDFEMTNISGGTPPVSYTGGPQTASPIPRPTAMNP